MKAGILLLCLLSLASCVTRQSEFPKLTESQKLAELRRILEVE